MTIAKHRVVVVEDDTSMKLAMKRVLEMAGFHAETFASGEDLLHARTASKAACLLVDLRLPGLSGLDLVERLAEQRSFAPVIFVTACDDPANCEPAENAGAITYLRKPFDAKSLIEAVCKAIEST